MIRVLFVDDEPNILHGLRRMLRPLRDQWDMTFVTSASEALEVVVDNPCDVVVSDMKMPGMDGAEFLSRIKDRYPGSIRIALSGETDNHMIYRCVQHAHQYVAKPCDVETLVATVKRASVLRELMTDEKLKTLVSQLSSLPSLPEQYQKVMAELQSKDPSLEKIGGIIENDVAMTAKILQIVNSAFFGLVRQIASPTDAAKYLGLDVIKTLVLTTGVFSQFEDSAVSRNLLQTIWTSSLRVATLARAIGRRHGTDPLIADYAYMGGLLSEIGRLVFVANLPESFLEVEQLVAAGTDRSQAERDVFGHPHQEVGAYLVSLWGLPNPVVECVAFHAEPGGCPADHFSPAAAVHIAHSIVHDTARGDTPQHLDLEFLEKLGVADQLPEWMKLANKQDDALEDDPGV